MNILTNFKETVWSTLTHLSAETVGWIAIIIVHASTIPNFVAVMNGLTDKMPQLDILLMMWAGLTLFFLKAIIQKDMLNIITIGLGFVMQATMLALIFIK